MPNFKDNQARLQLFALAYNIGNFLRRLALPRSVKHWSLTTRSDPINPDDPEYIVRLVGQVIRVSVETVKIVAALPQHYAPEPEAPPSAG